MTTTDPTSPAPPTDADGDLHTGIQAVSVLRAAGYPELADWVLELAAGDGQAVYVLPTEPETVTELWEDELTAAAEALLEQDGNDDDRSVAAYILRAVLPDHDARVRADERARVAGEIRAHADRHAPAGYPLNHPRTILRRHLLLAARLADGSLTGDDLAHIAAQVVGLARQHATPPTEGDHRG